MQIGYVLLSVLFATPPGIGQTTLTKSDVAHTVERFDEGFYTGVHLYPEAPLEVLLECIPELESLQPASDQRELAFILKNTGLKVDDYFRDVMNLIADEEVTQKTLSRSGATLKEQRLHYCYMILLHNEEKPARFEEFRQDSLGKNRRTERKCQRFLGYHWVYHEVPVFLNRAPERLDVSLSWRTDAG